MKKITLFRSIWDYLSPPVFAGDEEKTRVARVLNATLMIYYVALAVIGLAAATIYVNKPVSLLLVGVSFILVSLIRWLMLRGRVQLAGIIGAVFQWLLFTIIIAISGGMSTITGAFYLAGTVMTGLMLGARAAGLFSLMSIAAGAAMTILEANGHPIPRLFPGPASTGLIDLSVTLILTTMAVNINLVSLKNALRQARKELQERLAVEKELRLSETRYRALFETAGYPILLIDAATQKLIDSNAAASALYGYNPQEFLQLSMQDMAPRPETSESALQTGNNPPNHTVHRKKDGTLFAVEMTTGLIFIQNRKILVGFINDISGRRRREIEMEAIVAIGAAMRRAPNRQELLEIILRQVLDMLGAEGAALLVSDPYTREMVVELGSGKFEAATGKRAASQLDPQYLAVIRGLTRESSSAPTEFLSQLSFLGAGSILDCSPLINQEEILGVLLVGHSQAMSADQRRLLTLISEIAASALKRITLFEASTNQARQLAIASEIGLILAQTLDLPRLYLRAGQHIMSMFPDVAALVVSLYDSASQMFSCVYAYADGQEMETTAIPLLPLEPPGHGLQSQVVYTRRPVIIPNLWEARKKLQKSVVVGGDEASLTRSSLFVPMLAGETILGVVNLQSYTLNRFSQNDAELLTLVSNTFAVAIENARLLNGLQKSNLELSTAYDATISGWSRALDLRDMETEGHSQRVAGLAVRLGQMLALGETELVQLRRGALLHDIGKIGVPDGILLKPAALNAEEWERMRMHPVYALEMLSPIEFLGGALDIPYAHHEKWDGSGYPRRLQGEQIPLAARIFAVIDVWDALTSDRPYRKRWPREKVIEHIQAQSGQHFDPAVVNMFMQLMEVN